MVSTGTQSRCKAESLEILNLLLACPNIDCFILKRGMSGYGQVDEIAEKVSNHPETTFRNLTQLWYELYPTDETWQMLLCMPSLRQLAIGEMGLKLDPYLAAPPPNFPTFALERLTVMGEVDYYDWILYSSSDSLRYLNLHCVCITILDRTEAHAEFQAALERCGNSIRHIYLDQYDNGLLPTHSVLFLCPFLRTFKVSLTTSVTSMQTHQNLAAYLSGLQRSLEHLHLVYAGEFINDDGVAMVMELVEGHPVLQGLKRLCIETKGIMWSPEGEKRVDISPLRSVCLEKGVVLRTSSDEKINAGLQ